MKGRLESRLLKEARDLAEAIKILVGDETGLKRKKSKKMSGRKRG